MEKFEIQNCYDSHTHFVATGQVSLGLKLQNLKSAQDIKDILIKPEHYQGDWIVGFGWNQYSWADSALPDKSILDHLFPNAPVFLSRVDGHSSWINSAAIHTLEKLGYDFNHDPHGGKIVRDQKGQPTGLLLDQAHIQALLKLPPLTDQQVTLQIVEAMKIFNQAGFTHVRDLSMNSVTARLLSELYQSNKQTLCIDGFVTAESLKDLDRALSDYEKCLSFTNPFLKMRGLKIFVDGSLGSGTAYLSKNYSGSDSCGILIWSLDEIKKAIHYCWSKKMEIAVHVIGDQAADIVVQAAREVSAMGILGKIHLEHVQVLRPETVNKMKPLHIHCHMQPCHWLSDKSWIKNKIPDLYNSLFQWELLRKNKIPLSFGSDTPIEPSSLIRNIQALKDTENHGIPKLGADFKSFHAHPDMNWTKSKTIFDIEKIHEVHFNGYRII